MRRALPDATVAAIAMLKPPFKGAFKNGCGGKIRARHVATSFAKSWLSITMYVQIPSYI